MTDVYEVEADRGYVLGRVLELIGPFYSATYSPDKAGKLTSGSHICHYRLLALLLQMLSPLNQALGGFGCVVFNG